MTSLWEETFTFHGKPIVLFFIYGFGLVGSVKSLDLKSPRQQCYFEKVGVAHTNIESQRSDAS